MRINLILLLAMVSLSCGTSKRVQPTTQISNASTLILTEISTDETYGYTEQNPVKVGGENSGPANERRYLNALTGPNGETLTYERTGSCCHFKTNNGIMGAGLLDRYKVSYEGLANPIILYINMYDTDTLKAPKGFRIKSSFMNN